MNAMVMRLGPWRIERTLGRDLSGAYYAAHRDDGERATLYLLSRELGAGRRDLLARLLAQHHALSHPGLVRFRDLDHDGSDVYLIAEPVDEALASLRGRRPALSRARVVGAELASALATAHDQGVVHGGLELDNTLWAPDRGPRILGTGVAALGMPDPAALAHGDVAALGRLLCALVAGPAESLDSASDSAGQIVELVRILADPGSAISMREAQALLGGGGEPTRAMRWGRGTGELAATGAGIPAGDTETAPVTGDRLFTAATRPIGAGSLDAAPPSTAGPDQLGGYLGRYRILTCLGRGGMGEVFLAEDPALRRGVAIKRIRPGLERDRTFRARLRREAQLAARLNHRAIVQVFDLVTDDSADHVIMEYVAGPSLHTLVDGRPMEVADALRIAIELADGLDHAHQQGIIHRDLKLENILISTDRQPKIADFGIARRAASGAPGAGGSIEESLTRNGLAIGTARAMSPEQIQGPDIDARSDLFSFGVLLYELLTGTSPFAASNDAVTILRVLNDRQVPAREIAPGVPRALSDLIDQLLEKPPERRPPTARALRDRLREIAGEPGSASRPQPAPAETAPTGRPRNASAGGGERRQVTLACIDLVAAGGADSDELTDPELLADVLPAFRIRLDEILARYDGIVINALGHRFVACFGHPKPHEDAARRAVLAAREMLDAAAALRSADPAHARTHFAATGSVHTGLAIARGAGAGAGDELVLGATLDAALRLLQNGGAGDLWLSGSSARLVETEFELERPSAQAESTTAARRFSGPRAAAPGSGEHDRPMVARDHEMQILLGGWRRARQGQGQVALLIGEPGIGKSRLTRELATAIANDGPRQIVLRGGAYRQRSALEPVADAIAALLGLTGSGETTGELLGDDALDTRLRSLTGPDEAAHVLHLLGRAEAPPAGPPERARHQLLGGLRDILVGTSQDAPTLLVVEDLHWLDPSTLDLVALIIDDVAASPLFLVMTTRPGVAPRWPSSAAVTQLQLGRLESAAIDAVISHACADRTLPTAERALIAARSGGVPLYAQELVRAALEVGRAGEIPSTLRDALTARLHQLGGAATEVARVAAVAGREFTAELIAAAGDQDRAAVDRELERLVAGEILTRRRGRAREMVYQFGHVLLQQAAYDELLAPDRRHAHGRIADALLADERAGRDPGPELVAHQLAGARRFSEAIAHAQRAALRALGRHARIEAGELFRQALAWLEQLPESEARDRSEIGLRMQLGAVLISTEGYTSAELERSCRRAETLCARHDDMSLPVKHGLWAARFMRGTHEEVEPLNAWYEQVIARGGSPIELLIAHQALGVYANARADYGRARAELERAMVLFRPEDHADVVRLYGGGGGFTSHIVLTTVLWQTGHLAETWAHQRRTVAQAEALDPYAVVSTLSFEMSMHISTGDVARAEATAERMLELSARYEFRYLACSAMCGRGWARARRGQAERAMTDLVTGTEGTRLIGVRIWYPYYLGLLADGATVLGDFDRAERALDEALDICHRAIDRSNEPELLRLRAKLILARDASAHDAARTVLREAIAISQQRDSRLPALRAALDLAALLSDLGRSDEAAAILGPAYHAFPAGLDDPNLAAARKLLGELRAS